VQAQQEFDGLVSSAVLQRTVMELANVDEQVNVTLARSLSLQALLVDEVMKRYARCGLSVYSETYDKHYSYKNKVSPAALLAMISTKDLQERSFQISVRTSVDNQISCPRRVIAAFWCETPQSTVVDAQPTCSSS